MAIQNLDPSIVTELAASGSLIAAARETIPFEATIKDPESGFIFSPQTTQVYDTSALKKAIDTGITEMSSPEQEVELDLVPRPLYEDALEALATAEQVIETQSATIADLEAKISELESQIETLASDLDNERLLRVVAEANADNFRQQLQLINESSQVALQRSILEGIQRSSAEATKESLRAEVEALKEKAITLQQTIDSLNAIINGKDAQLAAGAEAGINVTVRVISKPAPADEDLVLDVSIDDCNAGTGAFWINGPQIEIYNSSTTDQTISFDTSQCIADGQVWVQPVTGLTIPSQATATFSFSPSYPALSRVYPRTKFLTSARSYTGKIKVFANNIEQIALSTRVYKHKTG